MTTDVVLNTDNGYFDISFTEFGDIATRQSLDTTILMSIFEEVRASPQEVPESNFRRGWIGNASTPNFEQGSKVWQFDQERATSTMLAELRAVIQNGANKLVDEGLAVNVEVEQPFFKNGAIVSFITWIRDGSKVDRKLFTIWDNTGEGLNF